MEFKFAVNDVLRQPIVQIGPGLLPPGFAGDRRTFWDTVGKVSEIVNAMGEASAAAQGLTKPITTAERLRNSEHNLYLLIDQNAANGRGAVTGMLKTGKKGLYVFDRNGQHYQVSPPCVLDFYIHESRQRTGLGKHLFEHMLKTETIEPVKMAIDRPSEKFLGFLNKHYSLSNPVKQMNNYVVFDGFFPSVPEKNGTVERDHSGSSPGKKQSANGLQTTSFASPLGRYGAPRPPCSMGQIIHNQTSTIPKSTEPTGVECVRSAPETNYQNVAAKSPGNTNITQSVPNVYYRSQQPKVKLDGLSNVPAYPLTPQNAGQFQPNQQHIAGHDLNSNNRRNVDHPQNNYANQQQQTTQSSCEQQQQRIDEQQNIYATQPIHGVTQDASILQGPYTQTSNVLHNTSGMYYNPSPHNVYTPQQVPTENVRSYTQQYPSTSYPQNPNIQNKNLVLQDNQPNLVQYVSYDQSQLQNGQNVLEQSRPDVVNVYNSVSNQTQPSLVTPHLQNTEQNTSQQLNQVYGVGQPTSNQSQQIQQYQQPTPRSNVQYTYVVSDDMRPTNYQENSGFITENVSQNQIQPNNPGQIFNSTPHNPQNMPYSTNNSENDRPFYNATINQQPPNASFSTHFVPQANTQSTHLIDDTKSVPNMNTPFHYSTEMANQQQQQQQQPKMVTGEFMPQSNMSILESQYHPHSAQSNPQTNFNQIDQTQMSKPSTSQLVNQHNTNPLQNIKTSSIYTLPHQQQQQMQYQTSPHVEGNQLSKTNEQTDNVPDERCDTAPKENDMEYGYPPQVPDAGTQIMEEKVSTSPKLERPRSLSIQLSEEQTEDKKNDVESEVLPKETQVEEIIEKLAISENGSEVEQKDETLPAAENKAPGKRTPSHLTEQGFFDLKFYHNKLW